jgi:hypothetical protein
MKRTTWGVLPPPDLTKITEARLRQLCQLCHPDRHGGSKLALEVFHWLQEVRKILDARAEKR